MFSEQEDDPEEVRDALRVIADLQTKLEDFESQPRTRARDKLIDYLSKRLEQLKAFIANRSWVLISNIPSAFLADLLPISW